MIGTKSILRKRIDRRANQQLKQNTMTGHEPQCHEVSEIRLSKRRAARMIEVGGTDCQIEQGSCNFRRHQLFGQQC